jgi:flavin-binding protein dodecin
MSVAKVIEVTAESPESFDSAIAEGIMRASKTIDGIQSAWIKEQSVELRNNRPSAYRVKMKVTFLLKE